MKKKYLSLIICSSISTCSLLQSNQTIDVFPSQDFTMRSNISLDESNNFFDDDLLNFIDTNINSTSQTRADPAEIVDFLVQFGALDILQTYFYLHTNQINKRSLLDLPVFEPIRCCYPDAWVIGAHFFWNHMNRNYLTTCSDAMCSYLALQEPTLIGLLENTITDVKNLFDQNIFNLNIAQVLNLFSNATVEQRRIGLMWYGDRQWKRLHLRFMVPIYYQERNYFLTNSERSAIESEFGALSKKEQTRFQRNHAVSDRLGVGDFRLELDGAVWKSKGINVRIGVLATLPISFAFKKGLYGTHFSKSSCLPTFDFDRLFDLAEPTITEAQKAEAFAIITGFAEGALDRLSANLLDNQLGNGGHVGVGFLLRTATTLDKTPFKLFFRGPWAQDIDINGRGSFEYLIPATERRFFIAKINPKDFSSRDFEDPAQADSNLKFLAQEFVDRVYTQAFDVVIQPGFIFRWTTNVCYQGKRWGVRVLSDLWVQTREKFVDIDICDADREKIAVDKAKGFLAYQSKLGLSAVYKVDRPTRTWFISVNGDVTTFKKGIGRDWTITANLEANF